MDIEQLIALANYLDESGATEEADRLDALIRGAEAIPVQREPEPDLEVEDIKVAMDRFMSKPDMNLYQEIIQRLGDYMQLRMSVNQQQESGIAASTELVFNKLSEIADRLDSLGATAEADMVDAFIAKHAAKKKEEPAPAAEAPVSKADQVLEPKAEADTEQSKRYDDKHHHSLQVREPKSQKERMDLEGYKDTHHVHTYQPVKEAMEKEAASTRYCPEHIGVSMGRVGEATFQCPLDGKTYNWEVGFTDYDGKHHEGGSVAAQTPDSSGYEIPHRIFDSRENILNRVN